MGVKQGILPFQAFSLFNIFISPIEFNPFLKLTIFMLDWHSFRWHKISIPTATKFSKTCLATTISVLVAKKKMSLFFSPLNALISVCDGVQKWILAFVTSVQYSIYNAPFLWTKFENVFLLMFIQFSSLFFLIRFVHWDKIHMGIEKQKANAETKYLFQIGTYRRSWIISQGFNLFAYFFVQLRIFLCASEI